MEQASGQYVAGWAGMMAGQGEVPYSTALQAQGHLVMSTTGLTKRYGGATVVQDMNLRVPTGSVYGFLGPNGAGKSTTMKMILGLVHPTSGRIEVFGSEETQANRLEILRQVGSIIESPSCYPHLTARENLEIVRRLRGLPAGCIDEALEVVRLNGRTTQRKLVGHFSLGMKQRLGIACALMGQPKLLLLDEPTNGLDPSGIHEIRQLIKEMPRRFDCTVMVSSHLLSEIDQMADHVGIINAGRRVPWGTSTPGPGTGLRCAPPTTRLRPRCCPVRTRRATRAGFASRPSMTRPRARSALALPGRASG